MACFCDTWGFNLAFDNHASLGNVEALIAKEPAVLDKQIAARLLPGKKLKFYDGIGHRGMLNAPKYIREAVAAETRIMTAKNPVFMDQTYQPVGIKDE